MKPTTRIRKLATAVIILLATAGNVLIPTAQAQGTAFTYQGRLDDSNGPVTGLYDFEFRLYNAPGAGDQQGAAIASDDVGVTNGVFTVALDFGSQFPGADRWLQIDVRTNGTSVFTALAPRQKLSATPYAITAVNAQTVSGGVPTAQLTGVIALPQLPGAVVTNGASNVNLTGTFSGQHAGTGGGLTDLQVANLWQHQSPIVGWGWNQWDQTTAPSNLPPIAAIAAGGAHNLALLADRTVVAWGRYDRGQIDVPPGLSNVASIAAGALHSLARRQDGTVVAWGWDGYGQSTVPSGLTDVIAVAGGDYHSVALRANCTVVAWGGNLFGQTNVPAGLAGVQAIAANGEFNLGLRTNGTVVAWGRGLEGQTNLPPDLTNITAIAAGYFHGLALREDGTVVAWGDNAHGQTNLPAGLSNVVAIAAGVQHSVALRQDGTAIAWGAGQTATGNAPEYGQSIVPTPLAGVLAISAAGYHSLALRAPSVPARLASLGSNNVFDGTVAAAGFTGNGGGLTNVHAATLEGLASGSFWKLTGNPGNPGDFIGTTSPVPLELRTAGRTGLRLEPASSNWVNVIGGHAANQVLSNAYGATIGGGGPRSATEEGNTVSGDFGTIGGGRQNAAVYHETTVGGGRLNRANSLGSTISGGFTNTVTGDYGTIGGGRQNAVLFHESTVGGGRRNLAGGLNSTVSGGYENLTWHSYAVVAGGASNIANGPFSTVLGGFQNNASGAFALAAGFQALARHRGSFVFAAPDDNGNPLAWSPPFASTGPNQFLVRAPGGVGINTSRPEAALHVAGRFLRVDGANNEAAYLGSDGAGFDVQLGSFNPAITRVALFNPAATNYMDLFARGATFQGKVVSQTSDSIALQGINTSGSGFGVGGEASGTGIALYGNNPSTLGYAGSFDGNVRVNGALTINSFPSFAKLSVRSDGLGRAIEAFSSNANSAVYGDNTSGYGYGIAGKASGTGFALYGNNNNADGWAGWFDGNVRVNGGVAINSTSPGAKLSVRGDGSAGAIEAFSSIANSAVYGENSAVNGFGVAGRSTAAGGKGLYGQNTSGSGYGIVGEASGTGIALYGNNGNAGGWAGWFDGNVRVNGTINPPSDRNVKRDFAAVDSAEVLEKVARLSIQTWAYTNDASGSRHLGPIAQDFKAAFGLGSDDKSIATVDADGVALAAIQGLNQKLETRSQEAGEKIHQLAAENAALQARIEQLEKLISKLALKHD